MCTRRMNGNTGCYMHLSKIRIYPPCTAHQMPLVPPVHSQAELREQIAEGRRRAEEQTARLRKKGILPHASPPVHQKVSELPSIKALHT